jgi:hypothetical protein
MESKEAALETPPGARGGKEAAPLAHLSSLAHLGNGWRSRARRSRPRRVKGAAPRAAERAEQRRGARRGTFCLEGAT